MRSCRTRTGASVLIVLAAAVGCATGHSAGRMIKGSPARDLETLHRAHQQFDKHADLAPHVTTPGPAYSAWEGELKEGEEDIFAHVRPLIEHQEANRDKVESLALVETSAEAGAGAGAGVGKVHAFCEICILIMQMKERGQPHLCAGLNPDYFISCVENLESILRSDKAVVYWLRSGCMHLDREGPEIVKPCPAHAICAWVPNLFADVGIISPRNSLAPLCPRDFKYLPRIPRKPAAATAR